jgi:L-fucose/D-arabinose isomerase
MKEKDPMAEAKRLPVSKTTQRTVTFGVCATGDPRIDEDSRTRAVNIVKMVADAVARSVKLPDGTAAAVVWSDVLIDGEKQADQVARQFRQAGVDALILAPDTWAFPQLTLISLLSQLPAEMPVNITCGNSGPKPGVVFAHAVNGALAQSGRLSALNVGTWPDTGANPQMTESTELALVDWCYAAMTAAGLRGRRVVVFGHDSMGMETALAHVIPTRKTFGLEITRLDMKLLADMLAKKSYDAKELAALRKWVEKCAGPRLALADAAAGERFNQGLATYLIMRNLLNDLDAVGGGFMNQLEWGSDRRGVPLPIADTAESLLNSTFDHNGPKAAVPFATEADMQGLLTMLFTTWLSGGNPPLFMDFRKVWESWEIQSLAKKLGVKFTAKDLWAQRGIVDGDNSGSASFDWAGKPGDSVDTIMKNISFPPAELYYFPGGGNSVAFISPGGIEGIAARMAYSSLTGCFSMIWDEASTVEMPDKLAQAVANTSNITWPHTFVVPKYATMAEYKQYAPANHFHMTWNLRVARLQHWMDITNVLSVAPWVERPALIPGVDRPLPLMYLINGGENATKLRLAGR